ncbi:MAG TPA: GlsB/YeaQ/YmgE family stress response membrane protein [Candidatus Limnocylindrales bacterium]|jgi:uncharacterized membrane protein YeaQ/YmgE (transglycosylase-associated protein family)
MGLAAWLVLGAIAGYVAGTFIKGDEQLGVIGHVFLGIVGALIGGFIASQLTNGNFNNLDVIPAIVAIVGAFIAVFAYRALMGRGTTVRR